MDQNSLISEKNHKKHCRGEEKDESCTRICDLPDPILLLILSLLPTKEAIQTSVLSKRWVHLWRDISIIELEEGTPDKRKQFIDFVRRLLLVCDCSNLKNFSLSCEVGEDASQVNEWLLGFINPRIQELSLDLKGIEEPLVFPDHLFTSSTLTMFRLNMQHIFKLPSSIHFECLRTLSLKDIIFPDSSSTQWLFSGCPSLEELFLIDCNWVNVKAVTISSPLLQKIFIRELNYNDDDDNNKSEEDDDIGGQNVSNCCQVAVFGSNLKSFYYDGVHRNDYFLYDSTSVVNASIEIDSPYCWSESLDEHEDWYRDAGYFVFSLLKELPSVESLSISVIALTAISSTASLLGHLPLFSNLAELRLVSQLPIDLSCDALLAILHNSPCLQVVNFEGGVSLPKYYANYIFDPLLVCFRTHLKMIKIRGFCGYDEKELLAIKILLQSASVLKKLYICCSSVAYGSKRLKKLCKQIGSFPRGSMDCEIDFEYF